MWSHVASTHLDEYFDEHGGWPYPDRRRFKTPRAVPVLPSTSAVLNQSSVVATHHSVDVPASIEFEFDRECTEENHEHRAVLQQEHATFAAENQELQLTPTTAAASCAVTVAQSHTVIPIFVLVPYPVPMFAMGSPAAMTAPTNITPGSQWRPLLLTPSALGPTPSVRVSSPYVREPINYMVSRERGSYCDTLVFPDPFCEAKLVFEDTCVPRDPAASCMKDAQSSASF